MIEPIVVLAIWDAETEVWIAESDDVPGLATGASSLEELDEKLAVAVPELLAENGIPFEAEKSPLEIEVQHRRTS